MEITERMFAVKKILANLLAIALILHLSAIAFAADTGTLSATADHTTLHADSVVTITVSMEKCGKCQSISLSFLYSDVVFESVSGTWSTSGTATADYDADGKTAVLDYDSEADANGEIFKLKLKVKAGAPEGEQTITITPTIANGEISVSCDDTSIKLTIAAGESKDQSADVKAKYNVFTPEDVNSVDISWGAMEFDYNEGGQKWDEAAHKYVADPDAPAGWTVHNGSNTITLNNHSSKAVNASFAFHAESGYTGITGEFTYDSQKLTTALALEKPTADTAAKSYVVSFMPSGVLANTHSTSAYAKIGSITVTLD